MSEAPPIPDFDIEVLHCEIRKVYADVASTPDKGFVFNTGRPHALRLGYDDRLLDSIPESAIESFAGMGNPFSLGELRAGEHIVDVGSGAGIDSLIAGKLVGPEGRVIGVDITEEMVAKAQVAADDAGFDHVEFRQGYAESLPVTDGWANVVISNGVVNLCPDKASVFKEMYRVLEPGGKIQMTDILVNSPVPEDAKRDIQLWTG